LNEGAGTKIIQLTNGNFIRVGGTSTISGSNTYGFISCTDTAGTILWNKYFDDAAFSKIKYKGGCGSLTKVIELQDGNLLFCGAHSYEVDSLQLQVGPRFYLQKMNASTGTVIWSSFLVPKDSIGAFSGSSIEIHELPDSSIHFHVNRRSNTLQGYAGPSSNTYYHINAAGSFIEGKKIQLNSPVDTLASYYAGTDAHGNDVFYAEVTGNTPYHILFKESNNIVKWAKSYHSSLSIGSLNRITTATVGSNSIIIGGNFITRNFSGNTGNDEYQNYLIKTDTLGNTNCSDTFSIPIVITKADTVVQYPATWNNQQGIISTPVKIVNEDLLPYEMRDCLVKTPCCNDTVKYISNVICNNTAYTLPDNTKVTQPGIYSSYFQTPKGCDSVIFTTLTREGIPSIQLGNDTCLTGSSTILLHPQTTNAASSSFLWQDGSRDSFYTIKKPGLYWVRDSTGCGTVSDSIMVYSDCNLPIYIPNAFTPNGDGLNDVFKISDMRNQALIDFSIYNRYGQVVFKTTDPKKGWDGKISGIDQPISAFVYIVRYKDFTGKLQSINGTVALLR
jgi:gliding motility-associated-like protein